MGKIEEGIFLPATNHDLNFARHISLQVSLSHYSTIRILLQTEMK